MRNSIFLFFIANFLFSCKKNYDCACYSDRRGYVIQQYTHSYKEKTKDTALFNCKNDYEDSSGYVNGGYCEIK